ncbi:MAG: ATP-binding cassette domain-containing protein [Pseudomonadota bacterium]
MIEIENLSFNRGKNPVLKDIMLRIPKGGVTGLIGPNGAGKSTLLSLIARLEPLQTGSIFVEDLEIGRCADDILARKLAILPQTTETAPRLSVAELVAFGRYPYHKGHPTELDRAKIAEAIATFELQDLAHRPLDSLSGGQRQRASVAMTFAQDTDYILLDEPLNNLDIAASRALMSLLRRLSKEHGRTIVIVLHDINYAASYADQIVTMKDGRITAMGPPAEIVTEEMLRSVFATDATVHRIGNRPVVEV